MAFLITVFSIPAFTGIIFVLNKIFKTKICPICGGVSLTWIFLVSARYLGYEIDALIPAILMGGTVVGIAYLSEKFLLNAAYSLLWKTLFIPTGFLAVYSFFSMPMRFFLISLFPVFTVVLFFFVPNFLYSKEKEISKNKKDIQEKLKNCC